MMIGWAMTSYKQSKPINSEEVKTQLKTRLVQRVDELFERLPEGSSVAEIEKALLKESPELTSEMFQALVDRQDFSPSGGTHTKIRATKKRTEEK
jgi:phage regulator Rha-like protein